MLPRPRRSSSARIGRAGRWRDRGAAALANTERLRDKRRVIVFLNGEFVPEDAAVVSVFDRGFLYGDGLFETLHVIEAIPLRWDEHWRRLADGAARLNVKLTYTSEFLRDQAIELCRNNELEECLLRLAVSRGIGRRGYSPAGADEPTVIMTVHPSPMHTATAPQWKLSTSSLRVPVGDSLSACKSANKLLHVLARAEAEAAGADESLLLNARGEISVATSANLFWIEGDALYTPPLSSGALPGVTRADVLAWGRANGIATHEITAEPARLLGTDGCFLTSSAWGVVEIVGLDGRLLRTSPLTNRIRDELLNAWRAEAKSHRMRA